MGKLEVRTSSCRVRYRLAIRSLATVGVFTLVVALQWSSGALQSELGGWSDEPAHYITGLMVRDYIAAGLPASPMRWAENYYLHYPQVALGVWPPLFYVVEAGWTLLFPPSPFSVLLLMAVLTTLLAETVYSAVSSEFSAAAGLGMALLLVLLPIVQQYTGMVMAEILLVLLIFRATLCFGRFLETEKWQDAASFGVWAALAVLTKGNGLALALMVPVAVLLSRRVYLIRRPSFWYPAAIALVFCGPWYWFTLNMARYSGWRAVAPTLAFATIAIPFYWSTLVNIMGVGLLVLAAVGLAVRVVMPLPDKGAQGKWAALGALVVSVWIYQVVVPVGPEDRYVISVVPALVMFLAAGVAWLADHLPLRGVTPTQRVALVASVSALLFAKEAFSIPRKMYSGFGEVAKRVVSAPEFQQAVVLISSNAGGEGMFISEAATQEQRPGHIVLRASKSLAKSNWNSEGYEVIYHTPPELMTFLERIPVRVLIIDESVPPGHLQHHDILRNMVAAYPDRWVEIGSYPVIRETEILPNGLRVYRLLGGENRPPGTIQLDLTRTLNKMIESPKPAE